MTATLYSYSDASAPVLSTSNDGSLYNILKAVLIDGYGSRTPAFAGWSIPFEDVPNTVFVLKSTALNAYLWIDDGIDYRWAHAYMYRTMSAVNTGTDQVPNSTSLKSTNHFISKRYTSAATYEEWHMLVDDDGKWFYFWTYGGVYPCGFFFGEIVPDNDAWPLSKILLTGWDDTTSLGTNDFQYCLFDAKGQSRWYLQDDRYSFGEQGGESISPHYESNTSFENPNPADGKIYFEPMKVYMATSPVIHIGKLPNYFRNYGSSATFNRHQKITLGADTYIALRRSSVDYLFKYDSDSG